LGWQVDRCDSYEADLKALLKRFPRAASDIDAAFKDGPPEGAFALPKYKELLWKTRVASSDLNKGKSGGFRVIYYWNRELPNACCLGACYFKGDAEDLPLKEVMRLFTTLRARIARLREGHSAD
jgi:mRNA-degrading endonuclease RelE of RelBE toxin-antitoxin system